jgi:hypothetical protein
MGDDDPLVTEMPQGHALNMTSPRTNLAPAKARTPGSQTHDDQAEDERVVKTLESPLQYFQ